MTGRMAAGGLPIRLPIRTGTGIPRVHTTPYDRPIPQPPAKRSRRLKTTTEDGSLPMNDVAIITDAGLPSLKRQVFNPVIQRMQQAGINTHGISPDSLGFLLPQDMSTAKSWSVLLNLPILVPPAELSAMFRLQESTDSTRPPQRGDHLFYVRTSTLTVANFLQVKAKLEEAGQKYPKIDTWCEMLEYFADTDTEIYLRYVGTSATFSAWQRLSEDLNNLTGGFHHSIMEVLSEIDPEIVVGYSNKAGPIGETVGRRDYASRIYLRLRNVLIPPRVQARAFETYVAKRLGDLFRNRLSSTL